MNKNLRITIKTNNPQKIMQNNQNSQNLKIQINQEAKNTKNEILNFVEKKFNDLFIKINNLKTQEKKPIETPLKKTLVKKTPVKIPVKTTVKSIVKSTVKTPIKTPIKKSVKIPVKIPVKKQAKTLVQKPVKKIVKNSIKTQVKIINKPKTLNVKNTQLENEMKKIFQDSLKIFEAGILEKNNEKFINSLKFIIKSLKISFSNLKNDETLIKIEQNSNSLKNFCGIKLMKNGLEFLRKISEVIKLILKNNNIGKFLIDLISSQSKIVVRNYILIKNLN